MRRICKRTMMILSLSACSLLSQVAHSETISAEEAAALYETETTYSIFRKGKKIGNHSLKFVSSDTQMKISVDSRITVRVMKIPVFRFSYVSEEVWENDQLISVDSTTKTNKEVEKATLSNQDNISYLSNNSGNTESPLLRFATNHWHIGATGQTTLFNTIKGTAGNVTVSKAPDQTLLIGDVSLPVTHYTYTGDIEAESWYDNNHRWVKLAFKGSDGSKITYVINNP